MTISRFTYNLIFVFVVLVVFVFVQSVSATVTGVSVSTPAVCGLPTKLELYSELLHDPASPDYSDRLARTDAMDVPQSVKSVIYQFPLSDLSVNGSFASSPNSGMLDCGIDPVDFDSLPHQRILRPTLKC
jgi:hypothetical protein